MREGLREADVTYLAALMRGGATFERAVRIACPDVDPETIAAWRPLVEKAAAEPGFARPAPAAPTPEEERRALDAWLDSGRRASPGVTVVGRHGPRRRSS